MESELILCCKLLIHMGQRGLVFSIRLHRNMFHYNVTDVNVLIDSGETRFETHHSLAHAFLFLSPFYTMPCYFRKATRRTVLSRKMNCFGIWHRLLISEGVIGGIVCEMICEGRRINGMSCSSIHLRVRVFFCFLFNI